MLSLLFSLFLAMCVYVYKMYVHTHVGTVLAGFYFNSCIFNVSEWTFCLDLWRFYQCYY